MRRVKVVAREVWTKLSQNYEGNGKMFWKKVKVWKGAQVEKKRVNCRCWSKKRLSGIDGLSISMSC